MRLCLNSSTKKKCQIKFCEDAHASIPSFNSLSERSCSSGQTFIITTDSPSGRSLCDGFHLDCDEDLPSGTRPPGSWANLRAAKRTLNRYRHARRSAYTGNEKFVLFVPPAALEKASIRPSEEKFPDNSEYADFK